MHRIFIKLKKPNIGPFWPKILQKKVFLQKLQLHPFFKLDGTQTSCKKSKNFYESLWRKTIS